MATRVLLAIFLPVLLVQFFGREARFQMDVLMVAWFRTNFLPPGLCAFAVRICVVSDHYDQVRPSKLTNVMANVAK
jgi:hypothetical protein